MLAWIDLEATGLVATEHDLLEVAVLVTDDQLQEVDRFHRVVHWPTAALLAHLGPDSPEDALLRGAETTGVDRTVVELHARNNLWAESAKSTHYVADVDAQLAKFLACTSMATSTAENRQGLDASGMQSDASRTNRQGLDASGMQSDASRTLIAGSSIWFDRSFMIVNLPRSHTQLHYRSVDVSTLNELARRFWPQLYVESPRKRGIHRAMHDIEDSLRLCRYYVERIAKAATSEQRPDR